MLSDRIKELRNSYNYSQVQLAKKLSVTKQSVSNWENDNIWPSVELLIKLSFIFKVSTDYLLELDSREYIDVTGLSRDEKAHVQTIINDLIEAKKRNRM